MKLAKVQLRPDTTVTLLRAHKIVKKSKLLPIYASSGTIMPIHNIIIVIIPDDAVDRRKLGFLYNST